MVEENIHVQIFKRGHPLHPEGCAVVTVGDEEPQEYTLEEWQDLQNTQSSQSS